MARTVQECNTFIVTNLVSQFSTVGITINPTTWSKRNLLRLICYTFAISQSLFEQLYDVYIAKITSIQTKAAAGSKQWLQDRAFRFQYSSTSPQIVQFLTNGEVDYPVINPALRIVTAASIQNSVSNIVNIKVAKNSPLVALSSPELTAIQGYFNTIGVAGIVYNVLSTASDKLYLKGNIYYDSTYSPVIQANVIAAINSYLENLSRERFGGDILLSDLKAFIRAIEGVNDVALERVACRTNGQTLFGGTDMVLGFDELNRKYTMDSGYIIEETTASNTFADTLTFIPE